MSGAAMKCIRCDGGHVEELLPAWRNPDDSLTRRVRCDICDGTGEVADDRSQRILDVLAKLKDAAARLGEASKWTR